MIYSITIFDKDLPGDARLGKEIFQRSASTPFGAISVGDLILGESKTQGSELLPGAEYEVTKVLHQFFDSENEEGAQDYEHATFIQVQRKKEFVPGVLNVVWP